VLLSTVGVAVGSSVLVGVGVAVADSLVGVYVGVAVLLAAMDVEVGVAVAVDVATLSDTAIFTYTLCPNVSPRPFASVQ
jgi:hypothetical protein